MTILISVKSNQVELEWKEFGDRMAWVVSGFQIAVEFFDDYLEHPKAQRTD